MVQFSSRKPHHCLLLTNTNSTVPEYADEFVFVKYAYLFQSQISVSNFFDTLRGCSLKAASSFCIVKFCIMRCAHVSARLLICLLKSGNRRFPKFACRSFLLRSAYFCMFYPASRFWFLPFRLKRNSSFRRRLLAFLGKCLRRR